MRVYRWASNKTNTYRLDIILRKEQEDTGKSRCKHRISHPPLQQVKSTQGQKPVHHCEEGKLTNLTTTPGKLKLDKTIPT
jgi:hypothetical protein